ncbi:MAG: 50S ribosomal protein L23, large subunit ribosomal protein L23 [Microgenomates group bacterium GW2011_GWC1_39_7b]|uniref:50S ribosomal protein L23 n=3 Tax=Candidatus Woeseibacteriota TaxID=1752722 RepID=A0A0G0P1S0_9BACT|nr:MAG: 50S ribosomal protein L23 [Candidatus Woesebacteria bacterium GW2011_GWB1_39_10]KKR26329.1 MAG: 50S ribosomal protein L23, large subunit ribosomal protein L23 [Microgenomates group bacterium GW2011_GWC1_39_7b]KKR73888.1 MAG: 50S ribosomal protein L23 [Candidatus Woesebacteria bacterium GW2011_GWA2_40_7]KKS91019.1 MAG: 50S ribosomal protein L23 [Candidatus Woesebacteria bacterium GW2011_GWA1_43_12]
MITPIFTEKSLKLAKEGKYTFWVGKKQDKLSLKAQIAKLFGVHVIDIKTVTTSGEVKKNNRGVKVTTLRGKKAIVTLKEGEKIDLFEESKK